MGLDWDSINRPFGRAGESRVTVLRFTSMPGVMKMEGELRSTAAVANEMTPVEPYPDATRPQSSGLASAGAAVERHLPLTEPLQSLLSLHRDSCLS